MSGTYAVLIYLDTYKINSIEVTYKMKVSREISIGIDVRGKKCLDIQDIR